MPDASPMLNGGSEGLGEALRALPPLEPPAEGWARMRASLGAEAPARRTPHPAWWALAASLMLAAVLPFWRSADQPAVPTSTIAASPETQSATNPDADRLLALQRESALLDLLVTQRLNSGVQRADFAAVSGQVIERVQWIDTVLGDPETTSPTAQYALWSERVLLLRQLVDVDPVAGQSALPNPSYTL